MVTEAAATFGRSVTLRQVATGAFDSQTGKRAEDTVDHAVVANRLPVEQIGFTAGESRAPLAESRYEIDASSITVKPQRGWRLIDGSQVYEIVNVDMDVDRLGYVLDVVVERPGFD